MAYSQINHDPSSASYWATQSVDPGATLQEQPTETLGALSLTFRYSRTVVTGTRDDLLQYGIRIGKRGAGGEYTCGDLTDIAVLEPFANTFTSALSAQMSSGYTLVEYAWHACQAINPPAIGGGEKTGPALKRTVKSTAGGASGARMPDQLAMSVTLKTASRKHWGRIYLPVATPSSLDTANGRWVHGNMDVVAGWFDTFMDSCHGAGYDVGVWSYPKKAFMTVTELQIDDVVDVIRRRRSKQASYYKRYTPA